jgi:hypothetical protein
MAQAKMSSALARLLLEQALDRHAVARPLLDLVEHAVIRIERVARLLIRPVAHRARIADRATVCAARASVV